MRIAILFFAVFALADFSGAQTLSKINRKNVACSAGNIGSLNGKTLGTASGTISKINNLTVPSCGAGSPASQVLVLTPGQTLVLTPGQSLVLR